MNIVSAVELARWLPPDAPFGLTVDEVIDLSVALHGSPYWYPNAVAKGLPVRFYGRRVVIIPDDWAA